MAAHSLSILPFSFSSSGFSCRNSYVSPENLNSDVFISKLTGPKLSISPSTSRRNTSRRHSSTVAAPESALDLETHSLDEFLSQKSAKFSSRCIRSIAFGGREVFKSNYEKMGTEGLLMGILYEGTSLAAKKLRESGITIFKVREEAVNMLGGPERWNNPDPDYVLMTIFARRAIDWAINEKLKSGEKGEVTSSHLLLGIWSQEESAGHKIMANLGFNDDKAKELAKSMDTDVILNIKRGI